MNKRPTYAKLWNSRLQSWQEVRVFLENLLLLPSLCIFWKLFLCLTQIATLGTKFMSWIYLIRLHLWLPTFLYDNMCLWRNGVCKSLFYCRLLWSLFLSFSSGIHLNFLSISCELWLNKGKTSITAPTYEVLDICSSIWNARDLICPQWCKDLQDGSVWIMDM